MSTWVPDFYPAFRCRAAACLHSCCRGWEIDVDEASAGRYRKLSGLLGDALREALFADAEGWHFRLDGEERCPFLQKDGLCRLIRELGEEALCDICALHPRFFQEIGEDELWGLGLSCEAAAALLPERGGLRFVCRVCDYYGVSADYLLGRSESPASLEPETAREFLNNLRALAESGERVLESMGGRGHD